MIPKRGNKGGNKEHNSQVAPRVPQEPQNEPKLVPKVTKLRSKGFKMDPKIYQNLAQEEQKSGCPKGFKMNQNCCPKVTKLRFKGVRRQAKVEQKATLFVLLYAVSKAVLTYSKCFCLL